MTQDEMCEILQRQNAGYRFLRDLNLEEARTATFETRLRGMRQLLRFADTLPQQPHVPDDGTVARRWTRIRANYGARN